MIQSRHDAAGMSSEATMMMTPLNHQKPGVAEVVFFFHWFIHHLGNLLGILLLFCQETPRNLAPTWGTDCRAAKKKMAQRLDR